MREGSAALRAAGIVNAVPDAELLLAHVLGEDRPRLRVHPERMVPEDAARSYRALVGRRARREPLQYLVGTQEFWSLRFRVTPDVLIPRPETEEIIETFLRLNRRPDPVVIDLGTGSGCLAVAAAHEVPGARVNAIDISPAALEVARANAADHGVLSRVTFHVGDLFEPLGASGLEEAADFILSNPPYIDAGDVPSLEPEVRDHEPRVALTSGAEALAIHRRLAAAAPRWLAPGGHLIVEFGFGQEEGVREVYGGAGPLRLIEVLPDLAGIPRILVARRVNPAGAILRA